MKKVINFLFVVCLLNVAVAQESTKAPSYNKSLNGDANQTKLMLLPFDPLLYMSDIDREIAAKEQLSFDQIRQKIRWELDFTIGSYLKSKYHVLAILRENEPDVQKDLEYIFSSVAFSYEKANRNEVDKKTGPTGTSAKRTEVKNGQVVSSDINHERYMSTVVKQQDMLHYINKKYDPQLYLFITQVELKIDFKSYSSEMPGAFNRNFNVHYNIIDRNGKTISGGIASAPFSSESNSISLISNEAFSEIAYQIAERLPLTASANDLKNSDTTKQKK